MQSRVAHWLPLQVDVTVLPTQEASGLGELAQSLIFPAVLFAGLFFLSRRGGSGMPGGMGGISMLYHLREILTRLGVLLVAEQVAVGNGFSAFDDMDKLTDERSAQFLEATCKSLAQKAALLNR